MKPQLLRSLALLITVIAASATSNAQDVVAFWGFENDYDFSATAPSKMDFAGDVDNTASLNANMQVFLGAADNLDHNGGGGFTSYTSSASGITYGPTRTAKWDDLRGGGDLFDIGGNTSFLIDKQDGAGPLTDDFGNDALMYLVFDGTGYRDFEFRFDIEATPGDLAESFDVFYRVGGSGEWFRDPAQNNIALSFMDYPTPDPENQFADSGFIGLNSMLNNQSQIEVIIADFAEFGNNEMEIDNLEIVANAVPEPASAMAICFLGLAALSRRKRS